MAAVALVVLVALAAALHGQGNEPSHAREAKVQDPSPGRGSSTPADVPGTTGRIRTAGLPSESLPLAERIPVLRQAASDGNSEAACRLAVEILRCTWLGRRPPNERETWQEESLAKRGQLAEANQEAERQVRRIEQHRQCEAAGDLDPRESIMLLAQASARGHAPAIVVYFELGQHFHVARGHYLDPAFDAWRMQAGTWIEQAARAGNPEAVAALARALATDSDYASALVADDPERAYLHLRLQHLLAGESWDDQRRPAYRLDEATRAELAAQARSLHMARFGGRRFELRKLNPLALREAAEMNASEACGPGRAR